MGFVGDKTCKKCQMACPEMGCKENFTTLFYPLAEEKAEPDQAKLLLDRVQERLVNSGYDASQTAYDILMIW